MNIDRRDFLCVGVGALALAGGLEAYGEGSPPDSEEENPAAVEGAEEIALPAFEKDGAATLEKALMLRKSSRNYDGDGALSPEQVSRLLWATTGINRPDGRHRTTPSAVARYPVDVLAATPNGVYRYEPKKHSLIKALAQDIRRMIPLQPGFKKAAMILLYLANVKKIPGDDARFADIEIGCMVQNTYLQAASLGLGACVFALVKYDKVSETLGLGKNTLIRIAQAVGPLKD